MSAQYPPERPRQQDRPEGGPPRATGEVGGQPLAVRRGSVVTGGLVMLVLAILLSWLPLLGPLIAGGVGGWMIADPRRALTVALIPAVALAAVVVLVLVAFDLRVLGAVAGLGMFLFVVFQEIPLLVGAWAGGAYAGRA